MKTAASLAVLLAVGAFSRSAGAVPTTGPVAGFTEEEAATLRKGRPVRRPLESHSHLVGGNSWLVIEAPPAEVWRALGDLQTYKRMFRFVDRIDVLRSEGVRRTVQIEEMDTLYSLSYILNLKFDEARKDIEFHLDPSTREHLRDGWGFVHLDATPSGTTLVTFGAAVNPGNDMIRALFQEGLEEQLLAAPERLKRFIEREERRRMVARNMSRRAVHRGITRTRIDHFADRAAAMRARAEATAGAAAQGRPPVAVPGAIVEPTPIAAPVEPARERAFTLAPDSDCAR